MAEEKGIKETKEAVVGLLKLTAVLAKLFKDGVQATDAAALLAEYQSNPELKSALEEAYKGVQEIPAEVKDLHIAEGVELAMAAMKEIPAVVAALK